MFVVPVVDISHQILSFTASKLAAFRATYLFTMQNLSVLDVEHSRTRAKIPKRTNISN